MKAKRPDKFSTAVAMLSALLFSLCTVLGEDKVADSLSVEDVQAAVNAANPGDRVILPQGSVTWTSQVEIGKAITFQGAGVGQTIITNTQGDGSGTPNASAYMTLSLSAPDTGRLRITGLEIRMSGTAQGILAYGNLYGEIQIDNCKFVGARGRACRIGSLLSVLFYQCTFLDNYKTIDSYGGGSRDWSWQNPLTLGTIKGTVIEDCEFRYENYVIGGVTAVASQGFGARTTWRRNTVINEKAGLDFFPCIDAHGNQAVVEDDNTGVHRSNRSLEFYENTIVSDVAGGSTLSPVQIRGGTFICFGNTYTGSDVGNFFQMREEDGDDNGGRFNWIDPDAYPGYDMHWVWIWDNHANGELMGWSALDGTTSTFVREGVNLFLRAPRAGDPRVIPGRQASTPSDPVHPYQPLVYPHPWRTGGTPPSDPPSNAAASALSSTSIELTWQDNSADESQFKVERSLTPGGSFASVGTALGNAGSFTDGGLNPGTTYYYRVRASNAFGDSAYSNEASATTGAPAGGSEIPLMPELRFEAEAGLISLPFVVSEGVVSQATETTTPSDGGLLRHRFTISEAGEYAIQAIVKAPHGGANSFFINIDGEPTAPNMIWDLAVPTSGLEERTVTWPETAGRPKVFPLTVGEHTLYVRGREAGVEIGRITIKLPPPSPTGPRVRP